MWMTATTPPVTGEARVEAGDVVGGYLLDSAAADKLQSAPARSGEESDRFEEEIRTLMRSETPGILEVSDSDSRNSYFTALLGLVSLQGITTPVGDNGFIRTAATTTIPSMFPWLFRSSTPAPALLSPGAQVFAAAEAAAGEGNPGHVPFTCGAGNNGVVQPAGWDSGWSDPGEQAAVVGHGQKRCGKRKEAEEKGKGKLASPGKKGKAAAVGKCQGSGGKQAAGDDVKRCGCEGVEVRKEKEKLPFVHVRARRGQATDRHSLAERARREKINARMKLLQDLVPGCNKVSGTALVLEEIINHVQKLQRQVEILSMRLAAVNPSFDLSALDGFLDAADALAMIDLPNETWVCEVPATLSRQEGCVWQQHQVDGDALIAPQHQQQLLQVASTSEWARPPEGDVHHHLLLYRHGLLRYETSNPVPLQPNHVKTEL